MGLSLAERFALLPAEDRRQWVMSQPEDIVTQMAREEWWWTARPEQIPPPGDWSLCLILAGRGFGKSRSASEWLVQQALDHPADRQGFPTEWLMIAQTLSDARTISIEGPSGVLRVLDRRQIPYSYVRHPKPCIIFKDTGARVYFLGADSPDVGRGYNAAGAVLDEVCIAKGELVSTQWGLIPIEHVEAGDLVWTRGGYRRVQHAWLTATDVEIVEVETGVGTVRLTGAHRVWTQRGWVRADNLHLGDTMYSCLNTPKTQNPQQPLPSASGTGRPGTSTSAPDTTTTVAASCFTEPSGSNPTAPSSLDTKFTTSIGSDGTPDWPTWNSSPSTSTGFELSTSAPTKKSSACAPARIAVGGSSECGASESPGPSIAPFVEHNFNPQACGPNTAPPLVESRASRSMEPTPVIAVTKASGRADVYDLEVEGEPEFFAGSGQLLVHNCKWKKAKEAWFEGIMPSLRADLVGDHPRTLVTTTPKPIDLLREWVQRTDGSITLIRGSTFDNAANLSAYTLEELERRYAGTSIGRQELHGELLDARDGSLWAYSDIDLNRVEQVDEVMFTHVTVGVDPTLTEEGDEMGVVVVGRDGRNHMYVLADESIPGSGRPAARHIWQVFYRWGADTVVIEDNNAKRWMADVLVDAYNELRDEDLLFPPRTSPPVKTVDSRIGKKLRAEPVALRYEQSTVHHHGTFTQLEEEMLNFDPTDSHASPNRMDALVHACRHLMSGERKHMRVTAPSSLWIPTR